MFWILYGHIGKATVSNHTGEKGFALVFIDDFFPEITYGRAPYIETKPLHRSQMVAEKNEDVSVIFQMNVCHNMELENTLLEFADDVKVLQPKTVVKSMQKHLLDAAARYK